MLVAQAKEAAEWFTGNPVDDGKISKIHAILRCQMENIVLIGMPGSGKSTIGKLVAEKTGKTFVDADAQIVKAAGKPIPQIFAEEGEAGFRAWETKVLEDLGKRSGMVLATGGGCVTREGNYEILHQNGTIFCLNRSLERLPTEGRPLSQASRLEEMYRIRKPLYDRFADHEIDNNGAPEDTVRAILTLWEENA